MIQWVYEAVKSSNLFDKVIVATDDDRIFQTVQSFQGEVILTSQEHRSGTDRCIEVVENLNKEGSFFDAIVNIQGDEPGIKKTQIKQLLNQFLNPTIQIATLVKEIKDQAIVNDRNIVKCVFNSKYKALYFSRSPIPYSNNKTTKYYKHIGIYAYRNNTLLQIKNLSPTPLEITESLEQLRWLENDLPIHISITEHESIGIDSPEDLKVFVKKLDKEKD
jgi:3-deoxy-manno-octulosonate cytidylyltransferase (CMP-KDO synthetase)